ncbi:hypothetical protein SARC_11583 [Sphaeroforma arctica JP610]|uniref:Glycosyl-hydrolase 114-associated domain-containing protein n=1 Tax=Sphaeroforma arctica JP610 TaxID=667725 RepID=A0A0L0FGJ3_9EUKA|nr:hypothetical protein SARC_11583 [Sphaeroforma arctica JP610]KNC75902.1 hypothetical protein SARC_11583 [Sphaeroforma arctica JP610]|eukprot:XP_014149804.1 hypothetical protein SARC_11583 [Sphaeroforma arctica JP610]
MLNVDTGDWVNVWKNDDVTSWQWSSNTVDVANGPYVSDGEARVRWSTTNNKDAAQLDYLALKTSQ